MQSEIQGRARTDHPEEMQELRQSFLFPVNHQALPELLSGLQKKIQGVQVIRMPEKGPDQALPAQASGNGSRIR